MPRIFDFLDSHWPLISLASACKIFDFAMMLILKMANIITSHIDAMPSHSRPAPQCTGFITEAAHTSSRCSSQLCRRNDLANIILYAHAASRCCRLYDCSANSSYKASGRRHRRERRRPSPSDARVNLVSQAAMPMLADRPSRPRQSKRGGGSRHAAKFLAASPAQTGRLMILTR